MTANRVAWSLRTFALALLVDVGQGHAATIDAKDCGGGSSVALWAAILTAFLSGIGWIGVFIFNGRRADNTKRLQMMLDRTDAQIREFYAPLVALTDQLNSMSVVTDLTKRNSQGGSGHSFDPHLFERFFRPLHEEIVEILKTKIHLKEGADTPSFVDYFEHYAAQKVYWECKAASLPVGDLECRPFPAAFFWDLRKDYDKVSQRYENGVQELWHRRLPIFG